MTRLTLFIGLLALGCGVDTHGYSAPLCDHGVFAVRGLKPVATPDVIQLRQVLASTPNERMKPAVISSDGVACATASLPSACAKALDELNPSSGFARYCVDLCGDWHLATTLGDDVRAWSSAEALLAFLGAIDTTQEAALVAIAQGYQLSCDDLTSGGVKAAQNGFALIATKGNTCSTAGIIRYFLFVGPDGSVSELRHEQAKPGGEHCLY